jgi:hypothetical protein
MMMESSYSCNLCVCVCVCVCVCADVVQRYLPLLILLLAIIVLHLINRFVNRE